MTAVITLLAYTPANPTHATTSRLNFSVSSVVSLSISNCDSTNANSLVLDIDPTASGVFKSNCQTINVSTNTPGYSLSVKASSSDSSNNLVYQNPTSLNPKPVITPITASLAVSPTTMTANHWGFAAKGVNITLNPNTVTYPGLNFTGNYSANNQSNVYSALPTVDTTLYTTDTLPAQTDQIQFWYGTKVDLSQPAGAYATTITYTMIGATVPCLWDTSISFDDPLCQEPPYLAEVVRENNITTMQALTGTLCQSAIYDNTNKGVNDNNTVTLIDTRNSQDYQVRKLADNNCWMIDNLKLELTNGQILEPATSDVSGNTEVWFTQDGTQSGTALTGLTGNFTTNGHLTRDGTNDYTNPNYDAWRQVNFSSDEYCNGTDQDVLGGNINDYNTLTGCGYLYNFFTATASTSPQSQTANGSTASGSICPANWKLPSSYTGTTGSFGSVNGDFGNLDAAYGGSGEEHDSDLDTQGLWLSDGAFRGIYSGMWDHDDIDGGGFYVGFWSRSVNSSTSAYHLYFYYAYVNPSENGFERLFGSAVRCLVN